MLELDEGLVRTSRCRHYFHVARRSAIPANLEIVAKSPGSSLKKYNKQ